MTQRYTIEKNEYSLGECQYNESSNFFYYVLLVSSLLSIVRLSKENINRISFFIDIIYDCKQIKRTGVVVRGCSLVQIQCRYASSIDCSCSNGVILFTVVTKGREKEKRKKYILHIRRHTSRSLMLFLSSSIRKVTRMIVWLNDLVMKKK